MMKLTEEEVKLIEEKGLSLRHIFVREYSFNQYEAQTKFKFVCNCTEKEYCERYADDKYVGSCKCSSGSLDICPKSKPYKTFAFPGCSKYGFYTKGNMGSTFLVEKLPFDEGSFRLLYIESEGESKDCWTISPDGESHNRPYLKITHKVKGFIDCFPDETAYVYKSYDKGTSAIKLFKEIIKGKIIKPVFVFEDADNVYDFIEKNKSLKESKVFKELRQCLYDGYMMEMILIRYLSLISLCPSINKLVEENMEDLIVPIATSIFNKPALVEAEEQVHSVNEMINSLDSMGAVYKILYKENVPLEFYGLALDLYKVKEEKNDIIHFFSSIQYCRLYNSYIIQKMISLIMWGYKLIPLSNYMIEQYEKEYHDEIFTSKANHIIEQLQLYVSRKVYLEMNIESDAGRYPSLLREEAKVLGDKIKENYKAQMNDYWIRVKNTLTETLKPVFENSKIGRQLTPVIPESVNQLSQMLYFSEERPSLVCNYMDGTGIVFEVRNINEPEVPFIKVMPGNTIRCNAKIEYADGQEVYDEIITEFIEDVVSEIVDALSFFREAEGEPPEYQSEGEHIF